jgi:hypothetical protein
MNLEGALGLIRMALELEANESIQTRLEAVRDRLDYMISQPTEPSYQTAFVDDLKDLRDALRHVARVLTPAQLERLAVLSNGDDFSPAMAQEIQQAVNDNAATLAVAREAIQKLVMNRKALLDHFKATVAASEFLSWEVGDEPHTMPAEVGFLVPRQIFGNEFGGLISEFNFIKRFVALLAEASGEEDTRLELVSLSTTDPMVTIGVALGIASLIGGAATWALNSWKTVEEIREIRTRTRQLKSFSEEEVEKIFGDKIRAEVAAQVEAESKRLTASMNSGGRRNEVASGLQLHLREFLARVERGMTVEIKLITQSQEAEEELDEAAASVEEFAHLLRFPTPTGDPVLSIAGPEISEAAE